jgi:hypothetical protein
LTKWAGTTYLFLVRIFVVVGLLGAASDAYASPDAIGCIKELALPGYMGLVVTYIPARVEVRIAIGKDGKAKSVAYSTPVASGVFRQELDEYFADKTRYDAACAGRTISFFVSYEVQGTPTSFAQAEVRFSPPDQIVIICRPKIPALDPERKR